MGENRVNIEVWSPTIRRKEMHAVLTALVDERVGPGDGALQFAAFAKEKIGFDHCLALRSPATALHTALKALNLERGAGVLVSALSPFYYNLVLADSGLVPVFADVSEATACIGRETLEKITEPFRAIALHHPLGFLTDMTVFEDTAVPIIEDISTAFGSGYRADLPEGAEGTEGADGTFSGGENPDVRPVVSPELGTRPPSPAVLTVLGLEERDMITAGGGALLYAVDKRRAAALKNTGSLPAEYGMPDMNAAMAAVQMRECAKNIEKRREIAQMYTQAAMRGRHKRFVQPEGFVYNHYAFAVALETGMKEVRQYAAKYGVAVESAFENTLALSGLVKPENCPQAYGLALRTALFPLYPRLGLKNAETVAKVITTLP